MKKHLYMTLGLITFSLLGAGSAFAEGAPAAASPAMAIAILMGLAVLGGTFSQARAIAAALEAMGRNPSASKNIQNALILGLAFVESLVIFALAVVFVKMV